MLSHRTIIRWVVVAAMLFAVLLGARAMFNRAVHSGPDVAAAYTELGAALRQAEVLPLGADDELVLDLARLARDANTVSPKGEPASTGDVIMLGNVLEARSAERTVVQVRLHPQYANELLPGALRQALARLARLGAKAQLKAGPAQGAPGKARFTITVDEAEYACLAVFKGGKLDEITITAQ